MNIARIKILTNEIEILDNQISLLYSIKGKYGEQALFLDKEIYDLETKRIIKETALKSFTK